ncbi:MULTISPECIES: hypothetical protein [Mycobacteroides]|uniref:Uncharacterized protein n=2 Tax=Mycobacteriaceae TaxID=1762 RepID=A0AB73U5I9_MYCCH|nr:MULTISPECIES: hypothetical protein [Mycobacteroides]OHT57382.1 hypothetical protein BKG63_02000 [Mycobacteroides chelonae]OHT97054.1 hypothetical protein BKG72_11780 [Mycobacteroides chelonae]OLT94123.1 hypothetical protein BKG59_04110 [Mycobacteroides chelonae]QDF72348.1 hypothetical protein FJK96_20755 [Mycobacteroides chelonae]SHY40324.1 Uncharacterised protein [Mycobacteroides abscessus subsp. abscessus]
MAPAEFRTMTITTEVREPHVITLLCGDQVVGTLDLRKYMPWRTKLRIAVACWTKSMLAKLRSKPTSV